MRLWVFVFLLFLYFFFFFGFGIVLLTVFVRRALTMTCAHFVCVEGEYELEAMDDDDNSEIFCRVSISFTELLALMKYRFTYKIYICKVSGF